MEIPRRKRQVRVDYDAVLRQSQRRNVPNVGMLTHQVHGLWNGTVTLDDGTVLEIKDMYAFCEKVYNKW